MMIPTCATCGRERTLADAYDYNPIQVLTGKPLGWYSADDGEVCPACMTRLMHWPELPKRTPGQAGNEVEQLAPTIEGPPACFECERHPAAFELAAMEETSLGFSTGDTFRLCVHCVGQTAAALPGDVAVLITRLPKETAS